MKTYEYHVLIVSSDWLARYGGGDAKETLNGFGKDGWTIAGVVPSPDGAALIFQRESN